jgi:transcriptional/translational regulatory protein YebC/TACO1
MAALVDATAGLKQKFGDPASAKFVWRTDIVIPVEGDPAESLMKLLTSLDDLDDVQDVYSNEDISEAEMARLSA